MTQNRRNVMKGVGLGAGAAMLAASAGAQAQQRGPGMPTGHRPLKGIDITNIVTANGLGLGVKTRRGVLDVASVERDRKIGLPTKAIDVITGRGNLEALGMLLANGAAGAPAQPPAAAAASPLKAPSASAEAAASPTKQRAAAAAAGAAVATPSPARRGRAGSGEEANK